MLTPDLDDVEFALNPDSRCPCVLVLDTSGSMKGGKIKTLNDSLSRFRDALVNDPVAARRVELAIVAFSDQASVVSDFMTVENFQPPTLSAAGKTAMGAAILLGLQLVEARKESYKRNAISYYQPWVVVFTDGEPTDDISEAAARVKEAEATKKLVFFAFAVGAEADKDSLRQLSQRRFAVETADFGKLFEWLSSSLAKSTSSPLGAQIVVDEPADRII